MPTRAPSPTVEKTDGASEGSTAPQALASARWPGSNFKIAQILPGSVYLWACGERDEGDSTFPVSCPEVVAAWVVLTVKLIVVCLCISACFCLLHMEANQNGWI